jgi:phage-related protein
MARHSAVAPIMLLDVLDQQGNSYHFASMPIRSAAALGITPVFTGTTPAWNWHLRIGTWDDTYLPWLLTAGPFHLSRSMQSDVGSFVLQNMSGTSLERDMNKLITASAFEGALFAFREWNLDAQKAEFEFRGHLSIVSVTEQVAEFMGEQLFNPSDYQAVDLVSETCRWRYGSTACGHTGHPCQNTYVTCRLANKERFSAFVNDFVDVQPIGLANVSTRDVVRHRQV